MNDSCPMRLLRSILRLCAAALLAASVLLPADASARTVGRDQAVRLHFNVLRTPGLFEKAGIDIREPQTKNGFRIELRRRGVRVLRLRAHGSPRRIFTHSVRLARGRHEFMVRMAHGEARFILDSTQIGKAPGAPTGRVRVHFSASRAFQLDERPRIQRLGQIVFGDDFSRMETNAGIWQPISGEFGVNAARDPSTSQDAFQYYGRCPGGRGISLAASSQWFWTDYRAGVSGRWVGGPGAWGIVFSADSADRYYAVRWRHSADGSGTVQLLHVVRGRDAVLEERPLRCTPEQWNRMDVVLYGTRAAAYVNGVRVLEAHDPSLTGGRIGLLAEGKDPVFFDDVRVSSIQAPLPASAPLPEPFGPNEQPWCDFSKKSFFKDPYMLQWSHPRTLWRELPGGPPRERLFRTVCFHDLRFRWADPDHPLSIDEHRPVRVALFATDDGKDRKSGYRFTITGKQVVLERNGVPAARAVVEKVRELKSIECIADAGRIACLLNDRSAIEWRDPEPIQRGFLRAELGPVFDLPPGAGASALHWRDWRDHASVTSSHRLDYNFDFAATAWRVHSGVWQTTNRWACVPLWSFFAGRGRPGIPGVEHENCLIWCRRAFPGDFDLELFLSPLEGTPQRVHFSVPVTLNVAFCADGLQLDSGYVLVFGTYDLPTRLYSKGRLLAENRSRIIPLLRREPMRCYCRLTRPWQHIRIRR